MTELSLHILDIAENSASAGASLIEITVDENIEKDTLTIEIKDNGGGMDEEFVKTVTDPFATTRTTRKVGMGLSLFKMAAELAGGGLTIQSAIGEGTAVCVWFSHKHIDRQPIGDMASTVSSLILAHPAIDFVYKHRNGEKEFLLDTREIKKIAQDMINSPEVILWIKEYINEGLSDIKT